MKEMKKYVSPEIEVILIEAEDVCTLSVAEGDVKPTSWVELWQA